MSDELGPRPDGLAPVTTALLSETRTVVEREIEEAGNIVYFLNNFKNRMRPDNVANFSNNRWLLQYVPNVAGKQQKDFVYEGEASKHSAIWLNQTPEAFFEAIDLAMAEEGVTRDEVQRLDDEAVAIPGDFEKYEPISRYILPVYIRLRTQGYAHADLAT
jgi:hypothetical protein